VAVKDGWFNFLGRAGVAEPGKPFGSAAPVEQLKVAYQRLPFRVSR
jgi:hypothetical protein